MANTFISRDISSTSTPTKLTTSFWIKRHKLGSTQRIFSQSNDNNDRMYWRFESGDNFTAWNETGGSAWCSITTNRVFRDVGAWYHIVIKWDSTQNTSTDRIKMWVNGQNIDDTGGYSGYTAPTQNTTFGSFSSTSCKFDLGYYRESTNEYLEATMSHIHVCDGYAYDASSFGFTDATSGEWKINTAPNVSYGTNGFWILKDGNSLTDASPNTNNFTLGGGTLINAKDNPSNNFATLNVLNQVNSNADIYQAATRLDISGNWLGATTTLGVFKGKWYFEWLSDGNNHGAGIAQMGRRMSRTTEISTANTGYLGKYNDTWSFYNNGNTGYKLTNDTTTAYGSDLVNGSYGMLALDADNGKVWAGKDGTWFNSGDPVNGTNAMFDSLDNQYGWIFGVFGENSTTYVNFGNGAFNATQLTGTTYTDSNSQGTFKYQPPTNFLALCTKNLNV